MKITLNELRKIINNNLLTEALNFEAIVAQNPPYYQAFSERFYSYFENLRVKLKEKIINSITNNNGGYEDDREKIQKIDSAEYIKQFHDACHKYLLICVIEHNMDLFTLIYNLDENNLDNFVMNPTQGLKGKYTEFIVKILASNLYTIDMSNDTNFYNSFDLIKSFIGVCEKSASNAYKSKMQFFDTQIIPYLFELQATGKIRNVPKISPQSPLQDKVAKIFNEFGIVNGSNLMKIMLEEYFDKNSFNVQSFAGYDVKLIDFCLQHNYWQELNLPGQSANYRIFFINGGNKSNTEDTTGITRNEFYENWIARIDLDRMERQANRMGRDVEAYIEDTFEEVWEAEQGRINQANAGIDVNVQFSYRAMIYANNIYPFKMPYNVSKSTLSNNVEISYFRSIKDDDYLVPTDSDEFQIRKTVDWCTKDMNIFADYVSNTTKEPYTKSLINGFLLILDNSLPYNHPDGAALIGITEDVSYIRDNNNRIIQTQYSYKTIHELNANDKSYKLPHFIKDFCEQKPELFTYITKLKQKYSPLINLKADLDFKNIESGQQSHQLLQKLLNQLTNSNLTENSLRLLRTYVRYLLS